MTIITQYKQKSSYFELYNHKGECLYRFSGTYMSHQDGIITLKKHNGEIWELELVTHPFNPVYGKDSKVLILGSFPPPSSEQYGFYYGHKKNNFWKNLAEILKSEIIYDTPEAKRELLDKHKIALWDIIKSCVKKRNSSSDSDIVFSSIIPNDLTEIFQNAPHIKAVITTGNLASKIYHKYYIERKHVHENTIKGFPNNFSSNIVDSSCFEKHTKNQGTEPIDKDYHNVNKNEDKIHYKDKDYCHHNKDSVHKKCFPLHISICSSSQRNQKRKFKDELRQILEFL